MNEKSKTVELDERAVHKEAQVIGTDSYLISVPTTDEALEHLSLDEIIEKTEGDIKLYKKIRILSLKMTTPADWIDQRGKPYLQIDGTEAVATLWGVDYFGIKVDDGVEYKDDKGTYRLFTAEAKFYSKKLKRYVEEIGACSTRDEFFGTIGKEIKKLSEVSMVDIKKSAVTNCKIRGIKACIGLKNVTYDDLKEAGIDISKIQKIDYKNGAQKVSKTIDKDSVDLRNRIDKMAIQMAGGDEETKKQILKDNSIFEVTDEKGAKTERFVTDIKQLTSAKWIKSTYGRMKKAYQAAYPDEALPFEDESNG